MAAGGDDEFDPEFGEPLGSSGAARAEPEHAGPLDPEAVAAAADHAEQAAHAVTQALPTAEDRPGQLQMVRAVATAIASERHVIVEAPTGVGKSLGYLIPSLLSGRTVMVTTATKALQDQLANKDLPFLQTQLARSTGRHFTYAVLKGRSNYVCLQRLAEMSSSKEGQLELEEMANTTKAEIKKIAEWAASTTTGDQADITFAVSDRAWQAVSVSSDECPGASRCPMGAACWAERAREAAQDADVTVVNTHLYGLNVAAGGKILPEHDVVVVDEAHQLEDVMSDTVGLQIGAGRFTRVMSAAKRILDDVTVTGALADAGTLLRDVLARSLGQRLPRPLPGDVSEALVNGRLRLDALQAALRAITTDVDDAKQRVLRAQQLATRLSEHIDLALEFGPEYVAFVSGGPEVPRLEIAPLDVGPTLEAGIWSQRIAVLTSATVPISLGGRVGLAPDEFDQIAVDSPFDYSTNGLIYCALGLPDPRNAGYQPAMHADLEALITAAGGRTLALFTSYRAMDAAVEALRGRLDVPVLSQRDLPKNALVAEFAGDESSCLFATSGFFQGVDIPGRTLSLVTIDRIPFPRPDDPLLSARRERLGPAAFGQIDLPRAAMLMAQAAGRLIRSTTDKGVVAVFDKRLGTANYRWDLVRALPPMQRTRHRADAEAFLRAITR